MKIKKIFFEGGSVLFQKTADGQEIFYPWGYPGEAFLISPAQKKALNKFFYFFSFVILLSVFSLVGADMAGITSISIFTKIIVLGIDAVMAVYFCFVFHFRKGKKLYLLPIEMRPIKKVSILWTLVATQLLAVYSVLALDFAQALFAIVPLLSAICIIFIIRRMEKSRGYYFSQN
jgi:hypothetical protein